MGTYCRQARRRYFSALAGVAGAVCFCTPGPSGARAGQTGGPAEASTDIVLGGEVVMRIRSGGGGYTAGQRAGIVRDRLVPILSMTDLRPGDVKIRQSGEDSEAIYVKGRLLLTVGPALARANATTPAALAKVYAGRLRRLLPQVNAVARDPRTGRPVGLGGGR